MTERRRPAWIYHSGDEPDPRFSMANERTFLAWVRTSLGVLAGSVAMHVLEIPGTSWLRNLVVIGLALFGAVLALGALHRWMRIEHALRNRSPLPAFGLGMVLTAVLVVVAFALTIEIALS